MFHFMRMEDLQMLMNSGEYLDLVQNIKQEIQSAQYRAALNVNRELICLYYDIGSAINEHKTWGNKFIENLATGIPGSKRVFGAKSQIYGEVCAPFSEL